MINWFNKIFEIKGSFLFVFYYLESYFIKDLIMIVGDIVNILEVIVNFNFKNDVINIL